MPKRPPARFGWTADDVTVSPLSTQQQKIAASLPANEPIAAKRLQAMVKGGKIDNLDLIAILAVLGKR